MPIHTPQIACSLSLVLLFSLAAQLDTQLFAQPVEQAEAIEMVQQQAVFQLPKSTQERGAIESAAKWLKQKIYTGKLDYRDDFAPPANVQLDSLPDSASVIAWHDPTLAQSKRSLVGYLITDTLWAGHALQLTDKQAGNQLLQSLKDLRAQGNGLQEVLFAPVDQLRHQPVDPDVVHGHSIGQITLADNRVIDVRNFNLAENKELAASHPRLFAEVTVYQAVHDFWTGKQETARNRLRQIFRPSEDATKDQPIIWDHDRQLLLDLGNFDQWKTETDCPQFPIKLGTVLYALRLTGVESEFPEQTAAIQKRLWQAQHDANDRSAGGVAHFFIVHADDSIQRAPGATGEATAIAILATTVLRHESSNN